MVNKLTDGQKNLMRLVKRGAGCDGLAKVSGALLSLTADALHPELAIVTPTETGGGTAKLTQLGEELVKAMEYL